MLPKALSNFIIVTVTIAWAVNFAAQFVVANYKPDPLVHTIFMAICGGALALTRNKKNDDDNGGSGDGGKHSKDDPS